MDISERLKIIRKNTKLSQKQFAELINYSVSKIQEIERGTYKKFPLDLAELIHEKYPEYSKMWLITGEESNKEKFRNDFIDKTKALRLNQELMNIVLDATLREPELMSFAAKAVSGDKVALDRFIKLIKDS